VKDSIGSRENARFYMDKNVIIILIRNEYKKMLKIKKKSMKLGQESNTEERL